VTHSVHVDSGMHLKSANTSTPPQPEIRVIRQIRVIRVLFRIN